MTLTADDLDLSDLLDLTETFEEILASTQTAEVFDPAGTWLRYHGLHHPQVSTGNGFATVTADEARDYSVIQWNQPGHTRLLGVRAPSRAHLDRSPSAPDWITERGGWFYAGWLLRAPVDYHAEAKPLQDALRAAARGAEFAALVGPNPVYRYPERVPQVTEWARGEVRTIEEIQAEVSPLIPH